MLSSRAERHRRLFAVAQTLRVMTCIPAGRVWDPKKCVLVTPDSVPQVVSRGSELNGSSYASGQTS